MATFITVEGQVSLKGKVLVNVESVQMLRGDGKDVDLFFTGVTSTRRLSFETETHADQFILDVLDAQEDNHG